MSTPTENKYLGKEKISKLLLKFSIPCILALLITSLYNIVDQIFIGHGTAEGLGAIGNAATSIVFLLLSLRSPFLVCLAMALLLFFPFVRGVRILLAPIVPSVAVWSLHLLLALF